jgi:hypothetical protein
VPPGTISGDAGAALLSSDGTYYKTTYVEGATQYRVVAPPAGATLPAGTSLPPDRAAITLSGVTYYLWNTFYKRVVANGKESFVVITKPAGVVAVKALTSGFEPMQAGSMIYFRSKGRYYLTYLDPGGEELYVVVDEPKGACPRWPASPARKPRALRQAPPGRSRLRRRRRRHPRSPSQRWRLSSHSPARR